MEGSTKEKEKIKIFSFYLYTKCLFRLGVYTIFSLPVSQYGHSHFLLHILLRRVIDFLFGPYMKNLVLTLTLNLT